MNELYACVRIYAYIIYIYILPFEPLSHAPHPTLLGHRAPSWVSCVIQWIPSTYLFNAVFSVRPTLSFPTASTVHYLHLHLYSCPENRFISTVFLESTQVCVHCHVWLFVTSRTVARQAPLSVRFSRQEYWSGLPFLSPGELPDPGMEPTSLESPVLAGQFFNTQPPGKPCSWF